MTTSKTSRAGGRRRPSSAWLHLGLTGVSALLMTGCFVFDPSHYLEAGEDAGPVDPDAGGTPDAGPQDGGGDQPDAGVDAGVEQPDAGPEVFGLIEECISSRVPVLTLADAELEAFIPVDTTGFSNSYSNTRACVGRNTPGPDGFFAIDMLEGERWHFHARSSDPSGDPALYVLPTCDERSCTAALDLCGSGADEHFSFQATASQRYYIALDSALTTGFVGRIETYQIICGNNILQHGETCDDGNNAPGDGCDSECRTELSLDMASGHFNEQETNDDPFLANALPNRPSIVVDGEITKFCEVDYYTFEVTANQSLAVTLRARGAANCDGAPAFTLGFQNHSLSVLGTAEGPSGTDCAAMPASSTYLRSLPAGRYFVRIVANNPEERRFQYELSIEVTDPAA